MVECVTGNALPVTLSEILILGVHMHQFSFFFPKTGLEFHAESIF